MANKLYAALLIDRVWGIEPVFASGCVAKLEDTPAESMAAAYAAHPDDEDGEGLEYTMVGKTAVIGIEGPMTKKPTSMQRVFGGTSTISTRRALKSAANDPNVNRIALFIDSPGGQIAGTADLADTVAAAARVKPVIGYVDDMMCSAALWAASGCTQIVANPNAAHIGSIGTYMVVEDSSERHENAGVKVHLISSGGVKGQGTRGVAISDEYLADCQRVVNSHTQNFVDAVALNRGLDAESVNKLATGQTWFASEAKNLGLVDSLASWESLCDEWAAEDAKSNDTNMNILERIIGRRNPSADADVEQSAEAIALAEQVQKMADGLGKAFVASKIGELKSSNRLLPAAEASFGKLLNAALAADGGGSVLAIDGQVEVGAVTSAVLEFASALPEHELGATTLVSATDQAIIVGSEGDGTPSPGDEYRQIVHKTQATRKVKK